MLYPLSYEGGVAQEAAENLSRTCRQVRVAMVAARRSVERDAEDSSARWFRQPVPTRLGGGDDAAIPPLASTRGR
jgi:hypothetical protein